MGLLQTAYRTYENHASLVGVAVDEKEPLSPVSHAVMKAQITITLNDDGAFAGCEKIPRESCRTIIPVVEKSIGRVGDNNCPHPLCDQLRYLSPKWESKYRAYLEQLRAWASSAYTHPILKAVLRYIEKGTILADLSREGLIRLDEAGMPEKGGIEGTEFAKCLVRWRVQPVSEELGACWTNRKLFQNWTDYYASLPTDGVRDICLISGQEDRICENHPKGVVSNNYGAKLISANTNPAFTFLGRFTQANQAAVIGYTATQKAHLALHWLAADYGVIYGGRTFLCWNPEGKKVPNFGMLNLKSDKPMTVPSYREELRKVLGGYRKELTDMDDVVIASLDAATTGRLSVTYYNELRGSDFLDRIERWYSTCIWPSYRYGVTSPSLKRIAECAFGTQRNAFLELDDRILREQMQRLIHCIIDCQPIPQDIVRALTVRAGMPLAYKPGNRETVLFTACAVIRKYWNDRLKREEWKLSLDKNCEDRSYLFGRLLAVAEYVERSTYRNEEGREPNAIRLQAVYTQHPMRTWAILERAINPYYQKISIPGYRNKYRRMIEEIFAKPVFAPTNPNLDRPLEASYLLGYYHQRSAMYQKETNNQMMEGNENESAE